MLKKYVGLLLVWVCAFGFTKMVQAEECYYTNNNNVCFKKEEYDFISKMYWEGSQNLFTKEDYNKFLDSGLLDGELVVVTSDDVITPYSTSVTDGLKSLKIAKVCSSNCTIAITSTWNIIPAMRSYDVIGARLEGVTLVNTPVTSISSTMQSYNSSNIKKFVNGFGVSAKLPSSGTNIVVSQTFKTTMGGTVYASYQHSLNSISLSDSQNFTISNRGYGGVFLFSGVALNSYDQMNGVYISV